MVCLRNISVDTLHKGKTEDNDDDDNNDNNNNNNNNNTSDPQTTINPKAQAIYRPTNNLERKVCEDSGRKIAL
jgi:hypothetical protein